MNIEEVLEDIKRHLDYVNATNQSSIRDNQIKVMYEEIERLNEKIDNLQQKIDKVINKCINKQFETNAEWLVEFAKEIENILEGSDKE